MTPIASLAIGDNFKAMAKVTHPTMQAYAARIGARFVAIEDQKTSTIPYFEKFRVRDLLDEFDRVMLLDTDTIVRDDCPSLFGIVPENMLGMYGEGFMGSPEEQKVHAGILSAALKEYYGESLPATWNNEFYNTGVMVASRCHQELFNAPEREVKIEYWDQALLNARLVVKKVPVYDIGYRFNRMYYVDKKVGSHRLHSYIVHYAGIPDFIGMAKRDLDIWKVFQSIPNKMKAVPA